MDTTHTHVCLSLVRALALVFCLHFGYICIGACLMISCVSSIVTRFVHHRSVTDTRRLMPNKNSAKTTEDRDVIMCNGTRSAHIRFRIKLASDC